MAQAAGYKDHVQIGMSEIGGSRVMQHWDLPDETNVAKAALRSTQPVDVLTLSPIWLPDEGIVNFAQLGVKHQPTIRITIQEYWLPNDEYEPVYPLNARKVVDHNATDLAELRRQHEKYFRDFDELTIVVNHQLGRPAVFVVPAGQAVLALRDKIANGQAFGVRTQSELFTDSWGHPTMPIQVLATYCHFAVIYHRTPVGLPLPTSLANEKNPNWDTRLSGLLQELAWDAVIHHPLSGVRAS